MKNSKGQSAIEYLLLAGGVIVFVVVAVVLIRNVVLTPSQNATANLSNQIANYINTSNQTGVFQAPPTIGSSSYSLSDIGVGSAGGSNSSNLTNSTWVVNSSNYGFSSVYVTYQPVGLINSSGYILCAGPACNG
jgi:Flp pilus assembly pilin Flp